ncbi:MAG TPA: Fe-S cluster protein, partial [Nocardioidaceae bacterium]
AAPAQEAAPSSAGSLFDVAPSETEPAKAEEPAAQETELAAKAESTDGISSGGSLFDVAPSEPEPAKAEEPKAAAATEEAPATEAKPAQADISSAGSLFDIAPTEPEPPQAEEPKAEASEEEPEKAPAPEATTTSSNGEANEPKRPAGGIDENKSLFDF